MSRASGRSRLLHGALAGSTLLMATPVVAQSGSGSGLPNFGSGGGLYREDPATALGRYLRIITANPRNLEALTGAGRAALDVGDPQAAIGFYARAEAISPKNGRIKAGLGSALVMMNQEQAALGYFDDAVDLGVPEADIASDRGLAYDLRGSAKRAQRDYGIALRRGEDAETTRRLAYSMAIAGDGNGALVLLDPLLRKQDTAAWRARAFILAMNGDTAGATRAAEAVMPANTAAGFAPFFRKLPTLRPGEKAAAVHFGNFPGEGRPMRIDDLFNQAEVAARVALENTPRSVLDAGRVDGSQGAFGRLAARTPDSEGQLSARLSPPPTPAPRIAAVTPRPNAAPRNAAVPAPIATPPRAGPTSSSSPAPSPRPAPLPGFGAATASATLPAATPPPSATIRAISSPAPVPVTAVPSPTSTRLADISATIGAAARASVPPASPPSASPPSASPPSASPPSSVPIDLGFDRIFQSTQAPVSVVVPGATSSPSPAVTPPAMTSPPARNAVVVPTPTAAPAGVPVPSLTTSVAPASSPSAVPAASASLPAVTTSQADASPRLNDVRKVLETSLPPSSAPAGAGPGVSTVVPPPAPQPKVERPGVASSEPAVVRTVAAAPPPAPRPKVETPRVDTPRVEAATRVEARPTGVASEASRVWVQVAGGADEAALPSEWRRLKTKAPELLSAQTAWTTPLKATNRLLVGPFADQKEAQEFVNKLKPKGITAFAWTSAKDQAIAKLASR